MVGAMLGKWEEAANDLHITSKMDYDEEIGSSLKKVIMDAFKCHSFLESVVRPFVRLW